MPMKCDECKQDVSDANKPCDHCGYAGHLWDQRIQKMQNLEKTPVYRSIRVLICIGIAWLIYSVVFKVRTPTVGKVATIPASQPMPPSRTYTPAQLKHMISNKKFPAVGNPKSEVKYKTFESCAVLVNEIKSSTGKHYPYLTIVETQIVYMVKFWTNDGEVLVTCSGPDKKMTTTVSPYL